MGNFFEDILSGVGLIPSEEEKHALRLGKEVTGAQAERIRQGTRLRSELENMIKEAAEGGRPPVWRLGIRPGEGSDIEEFISGIRPMADINHLMRLLGIGEGNVSGANALFGQGVGLKQERSDNLQDLARMLLGGF